MSHADMVDLRAIYEEAKRDDLKRWAIERRDFYNVHFRGERPARPWTVEEIAPSLGQQKPVVAEGSVESESARLHQLAVRMKAATGMPAALPAWARMTPEEEKRAKRKKVANG